MIITNKQRLPESLMNACQTEMHNKEGEISATTLLKGAKQIVLERRHWDELEDDVSNRCWALFGTAVHRLLEEQNPDAFTEERFAVEVGDKVVTGQVDLYDMVRSEITDYKTSSVWKIVYKSFDDWRKQGLIYAWLMKQNGLEVKRCRFVAMLRDWSKTEAERNADYPKSQVYEYCFEVEKDDLDEIEGFIRDKVSEVSNAEKYDDDKIEPCSAEERWEKPTTYAVMKEGRKTAVRVFDTKDEADKLASTDTKLSVVERKGQSVRCKDYCLCSKFCSFCKGEEE